MGRSILLITPGAGRVLLLVLIILAAAPAKEARLVEMQKPRLDLRYLPEDASTQDTLILRVDIALDSGWHVNSAAPMDEFAVPLTIHIGSDAMGFGIPRFPKPKLKEIEILGGAVSLYEDTFSIEVPAWRLSEAKADAWPPATRVSIGYQACSDFICLPPDSIVGTIGSDAQSEGLKVESARAERRETSLGPVTSKGQGGSPVEKPDWLEGNLLVVILGLLLAGLALNLTPCVYPMIAITISLFGTQDSPAPKRFLLSLLYVLGIVATFSILGTAAAMTGGLFGSLLQSPVAQGFIVAVFIILALGSFGLYEIRVPSSWMGGAMSASNMGGLAGALAAGLFAGILAAPCIGPVVLALLLYVAEQGSRLQGFWMFAVLAFGMGIPYLVLGTSSAMLGAMPKSGQWMVDVKKILGVVLLMLALYYARGFLPDRVYTVLFGAMLVYIALYINPFKSAQNLPRWSDALLRTAAFAVLLWGGDTLHRALFAKATFLSSHGELPTDARALQWMPYEEGRLEDARRDGKWAFIDFQSKIWCAACREMEEKTFSSPSVQASLSNAELLSVDVDHHPREEALRARFEVRGIPTLIVLDPAGREVDRIVGFLPPGEFLGRLRELSFPG